MREYLKKDPCRSMRIVQIVLAAVIAVQLCAIQLSGRTQPEDSTYCPWCRGYLCDRKFLFVIATGRSGSTSLMSMLNGVPGVFLSGENGNDPLRMLTILRPRLNRRCHHEYFASTQRAVLGTRDRCSRISRSELIAAQGWLWEANVPPNTIVSSPPNIVGFKEIRWSPQEIEFVQLVAPCSRFIFNTRKNATEQAMSGFFQKSVDHDASIKRVRKANNDALAARMVLSPERVYTAYLEEFSVELFNDIARWLGKDCHFNGVAHAHANNSYKPQEGVQCI